MLSLPEFVAGFDNIHLLCIEGSYDEIRSCLYSDPAAAHRHNENGLLPLHQVVLRDFDDVIQVLELVLSYNSDVNGRTIVEGDTALHLTVRNVRAEKASPIVRKLIWYGANPRVRNKRGVSAYDEAVGRCYVDLADLLNSDRWIRDRQALVTAICSGTLSDINKCLRLGCDVDKKTEVDAAPIHYVITHRLYPNKLAVLKILNKNNVYINSRNREGDSALTLAVKELNHDEDMLEIIQYLLDAGITHTMRNKNGKNARDLAFDREYEDVVEMLDSYKGKRRFMSEAHRKWFKAVEASRADQIRSLMEEKGNKKDIYNEEGMTPLHVLVNAPYHATQTKMIPLLLQAGMDVDAKTLNEGNTALHLTAVHNNNLAAEILLKSNCNTQWKNKKGETAVNVCERLGHQKVKALILAKQGGSSSCIIL